MDILLRKVDSVATWVHLTAAWILNHPDVQKIKKTAHWLPGTNGKQGIETRYNHAPFFA